MNVFAVRGALIYCGFSVAIYAMREAMIANGAASPWNPAWRLISTIYKLFKWSWWGGFIFATFFVGMFGLLYVVEKYERAKVREHEAVKALEKERHQEAVAEEYRKAKEQEELQQRKRKEEHERKLQIMRSEREQYIKQRSLNDAVKDAVKDFF